MTDLAAPPAAPGAPASAAAPGVASSGYRAHLDGLRAVAVYLVVLFHAGLAEFTGGFIGVDVFFVLSGYLVTRMLLKDVAGGGSIQFRRFYARRFRRLLPASAVAILVTAVVYSAVAGPIDIAGAERAFQASYLYVANWYFIRESTGYFGAAVETNPVLHVWSLAVEEQFYLLWPILLAGMIALARRAPWQPLRTVRVAVGLGAVVSLAWALVLQGPHPDRAYYGTDARAYQLLAGALLALTPGLVARFRGTGAAGRALGLASMAAVVVLGTSIISVAPITRGGIVTACTIALLIGLEAGPGGPLHWVLGRAPVVYLGRISYGTYLWHWPVIVLALIIGDPGPVGLAALTAIISTGLASLSYQILEMPVRRSALLDRVPMAVIAAGLAISVVAALLVIPAVIDRAGSSGADPDAVPVSEGFTPVPAGLDLVAVAQDRFGETVDCSDGAPQDCTVVQGTGPHVLLMGDSNAEMMIPAFTAMAQAEGMTLSLAVSEGCPWQRGFNFGREAVRATCQENKEDAYDRVIPALAPDVIVLVNTEYPTNLVPAARIQTTTRDSIPQLQAPGRVLALIEPIVQTPRDPGPIACLETATFVEDCRFVADVTPTPVDGLYRRQASTNPDVRSVDLDQLACPYLPICDPIVSGEVVRWDFQHLAAGYSATLGEELAAILRAASVLPA